MKDEATHKENLKIDRLSLNLSLSTNDFKKKEDTVEEDKYLNKTSIEKVFKPFFFVAFSLAISLFFNFIIYYLLGLYSDFAANITLIVLGSFVILVSSFAFFKYKFEPKKNKEKFYLNEDIQIAIGFLISGLYLLSLGISEVFDINIKGFYTLFINYDFGKAYEYFINTKDTTVNYSLGLDKTLIILKYNMYVFSIPIIVFFLVITLVAIFSKKSRSEVMPIIYWSPVALPAIAFSLFIGAVSFFPAIYSIVNIYYQDYMSSGFWIEESKNGFIALRITSLLLTYNLVILFYGLMRAYALSERETKSAKNTAVMSAMKSMHMSGQTLFYIVNIAIIIYSRIENIQLIFKIEILYLPLRANYQKTHFR